MFNHFLHENPNVYAKTWKNKAESDRPLMTT